MSPSFANLLLLTAGAIWGMGFVAQQTAMDDIGPMLFVALRFLLAGIVVLPFSIRELQKSGHPGFTLTVRQNFRWFFFVGLAFFFGMSFQQVGLIGTSVTNAGFLTALYVIMVPLIMVSILRVRQSPIIWPAATRTRARPARFRRWTRCAEATTIKAGQLWQVGRIGRTV